MPGLFPMAYAGGGQAMAFPDTCMTPGISAGAPGPFTWPNIVTLSDGKGSKKVKIKNKETMRQGDEFKASKGDAGGSSPTKGLVSCGNTGKCSIMMGAPTVKVEGKMVGHQLSVVGHNGSGVKNIPLGMITTVSQSNVKVAVDLNIAVKDGGTPDIFGPKCPAANWNSESVATAAPPVLDWLRKTDKRGPAAWERTLGADGGGGFVQGTAATTVLPKGTVLIRYFGGTTAPKFGSWWFLAPVADPIRDAAAPPASPMTDMVTVVLEKDEEVLIGPGAPRCENKPGGPTQICMAWRPDWSGTMTDLGTRKV